MIRHSVLAHGRWRLACASLLLLGLVQACATRPPANDSSVAVARAPASTPAPELVPPPAEVAPPEVSALPPVNVPDAVPVPEPRSAYGNPKSYVVAGKRYHVMDSASGYRSTGNASWYGRKFHGRRTSSGEIYDMYKMTAAHTTLPIPSYVRVTNLDNNKSVVVRVNDRGPFHHDRIIDLSYAAASKLDMLNGTTRVSVEAISPSGVSSAPAVSSPTLTAAAPAAPDSRDHRYLQLAAFSDEANASSLYQSLQQMGVGYLDIRPATVSGQLMHRVLIGPFRDDGMLNETRTRLASMGLASFPILD